MNCINILIETVDHLLQVAQTENSYTANMKNDSVGKDLKICFLKLFLYFSLTTLWIQGTSSL